MIVATPLDIPKIEPDNWKIFWDIWGKNATRLVKTSMNHKNSGSEIGDNTCWIGIDVYEEHNLKTAWTSNYVDIRDSLPSMYDQIKKIPIKNIYRVRLIQSIKNIEPHTDDNKNVWNIRSLFYCEDTEPQWYFTKPNYKINDEKYFLNLPKETNWFAYNDKNCWHGSIYNERYKKILIQVFHLDSTKSLVYHSINKYTNYTISLNYD